MGLLSADPSLKSFADEILLIYFLIPSVSLPEVRNHFQQLLQVEWAERVVATCKWFSCHTSTLNKIQHLNKSFGANATAQCQDNKMFWFHFVQRKRRSSARLSSVCSFTRFAILNSKLFSSFHAPWRILKRTWERERGLPFFILKGTLGEIPRWRPAENGVWLKAILVFLPN